ncbi:MAG: hypothetical protein IT378_07100 [Sandaracinaceae bacterium]|nr:hypothetical protein [Sandaracinaceae bacterium]
MGTVRELVGWLLLPLVIAIPPVALGLLLAVAVDTPHDWGEIVLFSTIAILLWPRLWLTAKRLREPAPDAIALVDERLPVALLHAFTRARAPWWQRLLLGQPKLLHDIADWRMERAITAGFDRVGPVVPLSRAAGLGEHGPISLERDTQWEAKVERLIASAAMCVVVVDATAANRLEIDRAWALLGPSRLVLVLPHRRDAAFVARWNGWRAQWPALPELDPRMVALRFDGEGRVARIDAMTGSLGAHVGLLASPHAMLAPHEAVAKTGMPHPLGWTLLAIPVLASIVTAIVAPFWAEAMGGDSGHDVPEIFGTAVLVCGVLIAIVARRYMRAVAPNDAVVLVLAALPWIAIGLGVLVGSAAGDVYGARRAIGRLVTGAAYAVPMLLATSFMLALFGFTRPATDRRLAYAVFGAAAVVPAATLLASLSEIADAEASLVWVFLAAITSGLAAWAASGSPKSTLGPPPVGAAVGASLAIVASGLVMLGQGWKHILGAHDQGSLALAIAAAREADTLRTAEPALVFFALAAVGTVTLVGLQFRGRGRGAASNVIPLFLFAVVIAAHAAMHASAAGLTAGGAESPRAMLASAVGEAPVYGLELPASSLPARPVTADVAIDDAGVLVSGVRVLDERTGLAEPIGLMRLKSVLRRERRHAPTPILRIAISPHRPASDLAAVADAALDAGYGTIEVIARRDDGSATALPLVVLPVSGEPRYFLSMEPYGTFLASSDASLRLHVQSPGELGAAARSAGISLVSVLPREGDTVGSVVERGEWARIAGLPQVALAHPGN